MEWQSASSIAYSQVQGASHVGLVVPQRLLSGLAHSLQTRKVNHSVGANLLEESLHTFKVEQVNLVELGGAASEFSDALEGLLGRVREVSMTTTSWPALSSSSTVWEPM